MPSPLMSLSVGAVITTTSAPTMGYFNRYNASAGGLTVTLPALAGLNVGARAALQKYSGDITSNTVTFNCAGSDKFDDAATSTLVLSFTAEQREIQVVDIAGVKRWKIVGTLGLRGYGGILPELYHDFGKDPNGAVPNKADSGQPWVINYPTITEPVDNTPSISGGKLVNTNTTSGSAASYVQAQLHGPITFAEADIEIDTTGTTHTSSVGLIVMGDHMDTTVPSGAGHVVFADSYVQWSVCDGTTMTAIGTALYPSIRGTGKRHIEIGLDQERGVGWARDPWGQVHQFTHAGIAGQGADWLWFEPFYVAANTDDRAFGHRVSADTTPFSTQGPLLNRARQLEYDYLVQSSGWRVAKPGASSATYTQPGTFSATVISQLISPTIYGPPSGKLLVTLNVWLNIPTAADVYLEAALSDGVTFVQVKSDLVVSSGAVAGQKRATAQFVLDTLTTGQAYTVNPRFMSSQADTQVVINPGGFINGTLTVVPL